MPGTGLKGHGQKNGKRCHGVPGFENGSAVAMPARNQDTSHMTTVIFSLELEDKVSSSLYHCHYSDTLGSNITISRSLLLLVFSQCNFLLSND